MVDPLTLSRVLHWALFLAIGLMAFLLQALPLDAGLSKWPGPQVMLAFAFAWVLRRPDFLPVGLFAAVALIADFLVMRPPGLWAALSVLSVEYLRLRHWPAREWSFLQEWGTAAGLFTAMLLGNRLLLSIFGVVQPSFGSELQQLISTTLIYPLVVFATTRVLKISRVQPGERGLRA